MSKLAKHLSIIQPATSLLVKLGSIAVHVEELLSPQGHQFDRTALEQLLKDPEVVAWMREMSKAGMLPVKRTRADAVAAVKRGREPASDGGGQQQAREGGKE